MTCICSAYVLLCFFMCYQYIELYSYALLILCRHVHKLNLDCCRYRPCKIHQCLQCTTIQNYAFCRETLLLILVCISIYSFCIIFLSFYFYFTCIYMQYHKFIYITNRHYIRTNDKNKEKSLWRWTTTQQTCEAV